MDTASLTADQIERHLADLESAIARLRELQARLIAEADRRQAASVDGCRAPYPTAAPWGPLPPVADAPGGQTLCPPAAGLGEGPCRRASASREVGGDRVVALCGSDIGVDDSFGWDISGLRRMIACWNRAVCEPMPLTGRRSRSHRRTSPHRESRLPTLPEGTRESMAARRADALLTLCADTGSPDEPEHVCST